MNAHLCGLWDGVHVWLQWDDVAPRAGYKIRLRVRRLGEQLWGDWLAIHGDRPFMRDWAVIATHRKGYEVQAELAVAGADEWGRAQEVTFLRSTCRFSFSSTRRLVRYDKGSIFHAIVDGAACHYSLAEEIEVPVGQEIVAMMEAASTTGYCQLDRPGHFVSTPTLGLVIQNIEPSIDDIQPTGRDHSLILSQPRREPLMIVLGGRPNPFLGTVQNA